MTKQRRSIFICLIGVFLSCEIVYAQLSLSLASGLAYSMQKGVKQEMGLNPAITYYDRIGLDFRGKNTWLGLGIDCGVLRKGDQTLRTENLNFNFHFQGYIKEIAGVKLGLGLDQMLSYDASKAYYADKIYFPKYRKLAPYFIGELSLISFKREQHKLEIGAGMHYSLSNYYSAEVFPWPGSIYLRNVYSYLYLSYKFSFKKQFKSFGASIGINPNN